MERQIVGETDSGRFAVELAAAATEAADGVGIRVLANATAGFGMPVDGQAALALDAAALSLLVNAWVGGAVGSRERRRRKWRRREMRCRCSTDMSVRACTHRTNSLGSRRSRSNSRSRYKRRRQYWQSRSLGRPMADSCLSTIGSD